MNDAEILIEFANYMNVKPWVEDIYFSYGNRKLFASSCDGQWDDAAYFYARVTGDDSQLATFACIGELERELEDVDPIFLMSRLDIVIGFAKTNPAVVPNIVMNNGGNGGNKEIVFKSSDTEAFYVIGSHRMAAYSNHPTQYKLTATIVEITPSSSELIQLRTRANEAKTRGSNHFFPYVNSRNGMFFFFDFKIPDSASSRMVFNNKTIKSNPKRRTYPIDQLLKILSIIREAESVLMKIVEKSFFIIEARSKSGALFSYILHPNSHMEELYGEKCCDDGHLTRAFEEATMSGDWLPEE